MGEKRKFDTKKNWTNKNRLARERLPRETFAFVGNRMCVWGDEKKRSQ